MTNTEIKYMVLRSGKVIPKKCSVKSNTLHKKNKTELLDTSLGNHEKCLGFFGSCLIFISSFALMCFLAALLNNDFYNSFTEMIFLLSKVLPIVLNQSIHYVSNHVSNLSLIILSKISIIIQYF